MSEQKYIKLIVKNYWNWWVGALIIGLIVGLMLTSNIKPTYSGSVLFSINRQEKVSQSSANYYLYDGYYSGQGAMGERDDLANWIASPVNVQAALTQAGQSTMANSSGLDKFFTMDTTQPSNQLTVDYTGKDQTVAKAIGDSLVSQVASNYKADGYTIEASKTFVTTAKSSNSLILAAIALGLALLTLVITLFVHYFATEN